MYSSYLSDKKHAQKKKLSTGKLQKTSEECGTLSDTCGPQLQQMCCASAYCDSYMLWQPLSFMGITRKLNKEFPMYFYIYYYYKSYPKLHVLSISPLYCYYKASILQPYSYIIVLVPSTIFQTCDIISCASSLSKK